MFFFGEKAKAAPELCPSLARFPTRGEAFCTGGCKFGMKVSSPARKPRTVVEKTIVEKMTSAATNAAEELQKLGGAKVVLATAPNSKAMSALIDGWVPMES